MKFEGVTFVEDAVKSMTKRAFIRQHVNVLWKDRSKDERKQLLSDVYSMIKKNK